MAARMKGRGQPSSLTFFVIIYGCQVCDVGTGLAPVRGRLRYELPIIPLLVSEHEQDYINYNSGHGQRYSHNNQYPLPFRSEPSPFLLASSICLFPPLETLYKHGFM